MLFWVADTLPRLRILHPLLVLGQSAPFLYLLHRAVIALVLSERNRQNSLTTFLLVYVGLVGFCLASAYGLRWGRKHVRVIWE